MAHPAPLFILAPPRSFTSVVCGVIGQHPEIFGVPELNLFRSETVEEYLTGRAKGQDGRRSPFWRLMRFDGTLRAVAQLYAGEQTLNAVDLAQRWLQRRVHLSTAAVVRELCDRVSPLILLDKSPSYVRRRVYLQRILDGFPDARFIHLLRHPRGVCDSIMKSEVGPLTALFLGAIDETDDGPTPDPQLLWLNSHLNILRFLEDVPPAQWMRIRGEDFLGNLEPEAAAVCRWLDIDDSAQSVEAMKHPEHSPFACLGPATARLGGDPTFLQAPHLRPFTAKALSLDGPLGWRPDGAGFNEDVRALAGRFGYS